MSHTEPHTDPEVPLQEEETMEEEGNLPLRTKKAVLATPLSEMEIKFQKLKEKVLDKRPILKEIIRKRGNKKLSDYANEYVTVNLNPALKQRQDEFLGTFRREVGKRLGEDIAASAVEQLEKHYFVSTADHHGPITHPFFINSNLLLAVPYYEHQYPSLKNVIVLACANVSLNNSSFPRGLIFNSYAKGKIQSHRLSFLPSNSHSCSVYNFRPYTGQEVEKVKRLLRNKVTAGDVHHEEADKIYSLLDKIYNTPEVLQCESFSDQITRTNFYLWKQYFKHETGHPNLIYLEQESLVVQLILEHHLFADTVINHMLFDPGYDSLVFQYFEGIMGTFSREDNWGTYLFWGISKDKNYRVSLWKEGNFLVSRDGTVKIELTPESLQHALQSKQILPSMMLIFAILSFYYGLKCLGGFSQVNYLTFMKNSYIKLHADRGNYRSIEVCARAQTKELIGDLTIAFLGGPNGELVPATGLDLLLYGNEKTWLQIMEESKQITLNEALNTMMPELYRIVYSDADRDAELAAMTSEEVTKLTHLDQKIKASMHVNTHSVNTRSININTLTYHKLWAGGNTTALVETATHRSSYSRSAQHIMKTDPSIEQVGFIEETSSLKTRFRLHMMGGEFCANAARSLAYYIAQKQGLNKVHLEVSGFPEELEIKIDKECAEISFPGNFFVRRKPVEEGDLIDLMGIRHIVIDHGVHYDAQSLIEKYQEDLPAIGIIRTSQHEFGMRIDPLIWVRNTNSFISETACGSGTVAAAISAYYRNPSQYTFKIVQPSQEKYEVTVVPQGNSFQNITLNGLIKYNGKVAVVLDDPLESGTLVHERIQQGISPQKKGSIAGKKMMAPANI